MERILPNRKEILDILNNIDTNLYTIHLNSSLFYGLSKMDKYQIGTYYKYNLKEKTIDDIKVIFNKKQDINFSNTNYFVFKFKKRKLLLKNIRWNNLFKEINDEKNEMKKIINTLGIKSNFERIKIILKRIFFKNDLYYNKFKYKEAYIHSTQKKVNNIEHLYNIHLDQIKKQIIALEFAKKYKISYEWILNNFNDFKKAKFKNAEFLD